jgi:hypothetical protein
VSLKDRPRAGTSAKWQHGAALFDLEIDLANGEVQTVRTYAKRWNRSRAWVAQRLDEAGLPSFLVAAKTEQVLVDQATEQGYEVLRNGWPDFILVHKETRRKRFVECKRPDPLDVLSPSQEKMHKALDECGIKVEVFRGEPGFIGPENGPENGPELGQKSLDFPGPSTKQTPDIRAPKRGKKTAPPDELSADDMGRLRQWMKMHKRPEVRLLESDLDLLVERCLAWHRGHDTRHANWYAAAQTWILKEPKKGVQTSPTTRSDRWDQEARKL